MGGGPILDDVYLPYSWPISGVFDLPLYGTYMSPGYYAFEVQSPLFGCRSAPQDWPSYTASRDHGREEVLKALTSNDEVRHTESVPKNGDKTFVTLNEASVQSEPVPEGEIQSDAEKRAGIQSEDMMENVGAFHGGENLREGGVQAEVDKDGRFQPAMVHEKETEYAEEQAEEKEAGNDEETRAATVVQARYRGHLIRKTRPLVQLRAITGIEGKLKRLKEQAASRVFKEELRKEKSKTKVGFEEATLALLIELDNIQGSHPLVRQIRKSVVREIVDLQETVDAFLAQ